MESEVFDHSIQNGTVKNELYDWVEVAVFAVVCVLLFFTFIGRTVTVDGQSMEPTLQHQDGLISSRFLYTPSYGDIVVITKPGLDPLIKRVVATEGQTIDIDFSSGAVTVDGVVLDEPYIANLTHKNYDMTFPATVPKGHVFAMGDNRNASWDSRASEVGMVDERYLLGRILYRFTPFNKHGNPDDSWEK